MIAYTEGDWCRFCELVNAISKLYENTRARVVTPDGDTDLFEINACVLQGDKLAPFLFAIILDYDMRHAVNGHEVDLGFELERRRSHRQPPVAVTDMDFADDIPLLTEEINRSCCRAWNVKLQK